MRWDPESIALWLFWLLWEVCLRCSRLPRLHLLLTLGPCSTDRSRLLQLWWQVDTHVRSQKLQTLRLGCKLLSEHGALLLLLLHELSKHVKVLIGCRGAEGWHCCHRVGAERPIRVADDITAATSVVQAVIWLCRLCRSFENVESG